MRPRSLRTVALLVETSRAYGRGILRGIARYARTQGRWSILFQDWQLEDPLPSWLGKGRCDGVIAHITTAALLRTLRRLGIPTIGVGQARPAGDVITVNNDNRLTVQLAVDHLRERGLRCLAYCGFAGVDYSVQRRDYFVSYVNTHHYRPLIYEGQAKYGASKLRRRESAELLYERELASWLVALPKPAGLLACNDIRGRQVLNACRVRGIAVPDQLAVVGVDNDELLCLLADPPLSSVILATERIGYEAAALLESLMNGHPPSVRDLYIEPVGVAPRLSSDVLAVQDQRVAEACRFIRQHACEGISVEDILDRLCAGDAPVVSRSTLEHRFRENLGRSPKEEILRVRLGRIQQLLVDTNWPLSKIAAHAGIDHVQYLSAFFKAKVGQTPGEFRKRRRLHP